MTLDITEVNGVAVKAMHKATCHCGAVELEVNLPKGLIDVRRCDCSMCRRRGAIVASVPLAAITVTKGEEFLKLYQFNTRTAKHYFCGECGIYTHHQRRSNPEQYGLNVACLEHINPLKIPDVPTYDGTSLPEDKQLQPWPQQTTGKTATMSADHKLMGPASYFPSIEQTYGQPVAHWMQLLESVRDRKHMEQVAYLKAEHEIGHGHANALVTWYREQQASLAE